MSAPLVDALHLNPAKDANVAARTSHHPNSRHLEPLKSGTALNPKYEGPEPLNPAPPNLSTQSSKIAFNSTSKTGNDQALNVCEAHVKTRDRAWFCFGKPCRTLTTAPFL